MAKKSHALRAVDAPLYRYRQALYLSFYSSRLYVDVVKRWRGFGICYVLLLIAVVSIPLSVRMIYGFNQYFNEQMLSPIKQLPRLLVQNGEVTFDKPMPYLIKNKSGAVVAMVDTTGKVKDMHDPMYPDLTMLITKNKIYFRSPPLHFQSATSDMNRHVYEQALEKDANEVFVGEEWVQSSGIFRVKYLTEVMVYPCVTMFLFSFYAGFLFMLALLGQVFARAIFKVKLYFQDACRLMAVASTPLIIVFFIMMTMRWQGLGIGYVYVALVATYFSYGVLAVRRESKRMVHA